MKVTTHTVFHVENGKLVSTDAMRGKTYVVYFYPKADTPGCTKESIAFSGLQRAFAKADTDVVGDKSP